MRLLVVGGTGFIGAALCEHLAGAGHEVTALARSRRPLPDGVEFVAGDVTGDGAVTAAVADHDAVVNLVALSALVQQPTGAHERVTYGGARTLLAAAAEGGTDRFLQVSAIDADPDGPTAYLRAKGRADRAVMEQADRWTIVRPSLVFGDGDEIRPFTRRVTIPYVTALPGGGRTPFHPIWVWDLVEAIRTALEDDEHVGEILEVGGPEVLTLADITKAIYAAQGRSVRIVPIPLALADVGFAIADPIPLVPFGRDQARAFRVENTAEDNRIADLGLDPADLLRFHEYLERAND